MLVERSRCKAVNIAHNYRSVRARSHSLSVLHGPLRRRYNHLLRPEALELAFHSKALRAICESEAQAVDTFGAAVASALRHRLADLSAAKSTNDLPVGKPRELQSDPTRMIIELCDGFSVMFCANHPKNPQTESGLIDWPKVNRIKILDIAHENQH
jgi:hypothetical protein